MNVNTTGYKILFFWILLFSVCPVCFAQDEQIDKLEKVLPLLRDTARIDCMTLLAERYTFIDKFDSALRWNQLVYTESRKINYVRGLAAIFFTKANITFKQDHNIPEVEKLAKESLRWFGLTGNKKGIEFPYLELGATLFFQGQTDEAYSYLQLSSNWAEKNGNREILEFANGFMYEQYRDIGDYQKAFDAFQRDLQVGLTFNGKIDTSREYYMLGELHRRIENYATALNYYRQFVQRIDLNHSNIWFRIGYPELFALNSSMDSAEYYYNLIDSTKLDAHDNCFYLVSLGEFCLLKKEYGQALSYLLRGLKYNQGASEIVQVKRVLLDIAKAYAGLQDYKQALVYTRQGLALSLRTNAKQFIRDAYEILYGIYQRKNKSDSAFSIMKNISIKKKSCRMMY